MADLDLAAQYAQQTNPMFGLTPEQSAAYLAHLSDLMRPPLLPQGLPPASSPPMYQSPVELSGQMGTGQGPPTLPRMMFRKAFPISATADEQFSPSTGEYSPEREMDPGDVDAHEVLRRQLIAQARGIPPGLPDAVLRSILQPDHMSYGEGELAGRREFNPAFMEEMRRRPLLGREDRLFDEILKSRDPTLLQPIADQDTEYDRKRVWNPPRYSDLGPNSSNVLTRVPNPVTTNADTVYYPPRNVQPVDPKEVGWNPNSRLRANVFRQNFGISDKVWPSQQQLDYYSDPSGLPPYPYNNMLIPSIP